jgi:hypothetical protein
VLASPYFSIDLNNSTKFPSSDCVSGVGVCPNITYGQGRLWDTSQVLWPFIETSNNFFVWSTLDSVLGSLNTSSVHSVQIALARTPPFAASGADTDAGACSYIKYGSSGLVTALSESGSTVTATSTFNPGLVTIVMSGDTPSGYDGVFTVTSSNSTQFQYTDTVTGLGAGTSFGTNCTTGTGCVGITLNNTYAGPGQCDPPTDLNSDGSGTNLYFRNWVGALGSHVSPASGYTATHAQIVDYEVWNEPDTNQFWSAKYGTYDQLMRMEQDAYFLIKGAANFTFSLTAANGSGAFNGTITNGASNYYVGQHFNVACGSNTLTNVTATASTATSITFGGNTTTSGSCSGSAVIVNRWTGETAAQVRATVTSVASCCNGTSGAADTTANIVMPSYHGNSPALGYGACFLYCTGTCTNPGGSNSCHVGGNVFTDAINFHMKPGASMESQMSTWIAAIDAIPLTTQELAKPLDNTEGGYNAAGWVAPYTDANLQASYIARFYAYSFSLGVDNNVWYDWTTNGNAGLGSVAANTAYSQIYSWMDGAVMGTLSTSSPLGSNCPGGTTCFTYTYTLTLPPTPTFPSGVPAAIMWDTSETCTPCTTNAQTVSSSYLSYLTTQGGSAKTSIISHSVPVGIQPILVQAQ